MAATAVSLNDLESHSPVAGLFKCNPSYICAVFYTISIFQHTVCSLGSSALAELFVIWADPIADTICGMTPNFKITFISCDLLISTFYCLTYR